MKWFDFVVLGIILLVIILQTIRAGKGMGLILLEAVGLLGCAKLTLSVYERVSQAVSISQPLALGGIFVISVIIWIIVAAILNNLTQWSWGQFDSFLGFIFGIVCAWTVGHMFLRFLILLYGPESTTASLIIESPVTKEILYFKTFTALFNLLNSARIGQEDTTPEKVLERR
jgi:uncharacterized membrane protein required for colicin V production